LHVTADRAAADAEPPGQVVARPGSGHLQQRQQAQQPARGTAHEIQDGAHGGQKLAAMCSSVRRNRQRRTAMPIPDGYTTITPWLIARDTPRLIDYVTSAFGAVELGRVTAADGRVEHAEVRIGDAVVMMFDAAPDWPPTPGFLRLYAEDADETHRRAIAAGGT